MQKLYGYRFEIILISQFLILFGGLLFSAAWYDQYLSPVFFILNLIAGLLLFSKNKKKLVIIMVLLSVALITQIADNYSFKGEAVVRGLRLASFFLFYIFLTLELVAQVWSAKIVSKNVIFGLISGYISLGLVGFFICITIESYHPNAFSGLTDKTSVTEDLIYYSYITLMTIGYGEIVPVIPSAKKAAVFIGLLGQLYLVVLTAIIVGKYINQTALDKE